MSATTREALGYGVPVAWLLVLVALFDHLGPVGRLLGATVGLLWAIKVGSWLVLRARGVDVELSPLQLALFWTVWPGVRPDLFAGGDEFADGDESADTDGGPDPDARTFATGYVFVLAGAVFVAVALLAVPVLGTAGSTWLLLAGLLAIVHLGVGRLLPFGLRVLGYRVPPLFRDPLASRSVAEFWSDRWNRPFVGMNRLLLTGPLAPRVGIAGAAAAAFLVSGVLHEVAISYAAGAGWGLPFLYFVVQAAAYTLEKYGSVTVEAHPVLGRVWTWAVVLAPVPLLFHAPFRTTFLAPAIDAGRAALVSEPLAAYVSAALWIGAAGHFLVLAASFQVPSRLGWHDDLESLQPFNRKLLWTYGGFVVLTIVAFGVLTVAFHDEFVAGNPVALGLAGFVAVFWIARVLVDAFYFTHDDWPVGLEFVVGHALLTSLFVLLIAIYAGTVAVHVV